MLNICRDRFVTTSFGHGLTFHVTLKIKILTFDMSLLMSYFVFGLLN